MNDKERILIQLIDDLYTTMLLAPSPRGFSREAFTDKWSNGSRVYTHMATYREPKPGDLVMCRTMRINDWKIGWYVRRIANDEAIIREIGTDRHCRVYNEQFMPIDGMRSEDLYEGNQYIFREKVIKAFRRKYEFKYRYGGVEFDKKNPRDATIWVREAHGGLHDNSKPFGIPIHWNKKTTIKSILQAMIDNGYGTKEFEKDAKPQDGS